MTLARANTHRASALRTKYHAQRGHGLIYQGRVIALRLHLATTWIRTDPLLRHLAGLVPTIQVQDPAILQTALMQVPDTMSTRRGNLARLPVHLEHTTTKPVQTPPPTVLMRVRDTLFSSKAPLSRAHASWASSSPHRVSQHASTHSPETTSIHCLQLDRVPAHLETTNLTRDRRIATKRVPVTL